jgi:hypothetical protein
MHLVLGSKPHQLNQRILLSPPRDAPLGGAAEAAICRFMTNSCSVGRDR